MLLLGLTGSIATGKSTVSNILRSPPYNLPIIDADKIAREVVEPGELAYEKIVQYFGPTTPDLLLPAPEDPNVSNKGRPLNRPALGKRVFGGDEERQRDRKVLNSIVHPAVRKAIYRKLAWFYIRGQWCVVLDVPLLFESGWDVLCGCIIVVACEPHTQMQRLRERDPHLSPEDAEGRVGSQGNVKEKVERAQLRGRGWGEVVWNEGSRDDLGKEVQRAVDGIVKRGTPSWWSGFCWLCPPAAGASAAWCFAWSWWMKRQWEGRSKQAKAKL